jgi:folate-dependent phosphoribosylglycinamide formyltransferase PurN
MQEKQSSYRIIIITGGEINHKYFCNKISEKYNVVHVFKIHSSLSNEEYFSNIYKDYNKYDKKVINTFIKQRIEAQEEFLLPDGNEFTDIAITHYRDGYLINDDKTISKIISFKPTHILLYGAPLLKSNFINAMNCPIVNLHMGVATKYRSGNANNIALLKRDYENVGYTFHHVTTAIDGGKIIYIGRYKNYKKNDNPHKITFKLLIDAVNVLKGLLPEIRYKIEENEHELPTYLPNEIFKVADIERVSDDFKSCMHLKE